MMDAKKKNVIATLALMMALAAPLFGQSAVVNSTWNGGTGPWFSAGNWTTAGVIGQAIPNNGNTVICNIDQQCQGFFNVAIASGNDLVTLDSHPVTIDSLNLGGITGNSSLVIGSTSSDSLTIGDIAAPVTAAAELNVSSQGVLTVNSSSALGLNIAAANGKAINNGAIDLNGGGVTGASLLINDAGNAHSLTLSGIGAINLQSGSMIKGVSGDELLVNNSTIQGSELILNLGVVNSGNLISAPTPTGIGLLIKANVNQSAFGGFAAGSFGLLNTGAISANRATQIDTTLSQAANIAPVINFGTITVGNNSLLNFVGNANSVVSLINSARGGDAGSIQIGGSGAGGSLLLIGANTTFDLNDGGAVISGAPAAGSLALSDNAQNKILGVTGSETLVIDLNETLSGAGTIGSLALVNNGSIVANGANALNIVPNAGGFKNTGTVQVNSGSTLTLDTTAATNQAVIGLNNIGNITVLDGGVLEIKAPSNAAVDIQNGGAGIINLGPGQNTGNGGGATLAIDGADSVFDVSPFANGSGTLQLSPIGNALIKGVTGTETLVLHNGETLQGAGTIENLSLINEGAITATSGGFLFITPNANGFENAGTVTLDSGSNLTVNTTAAVGTLKSGLTNSGQITVDDGATFEITSLAPGRSNLITNNGAILVGGSGAGGTLSLAGTNSTFAVNGTGSLVLSDNRGNSISGLTGSEILLLGSQTLSGAGIISNLQLVNDGSIVANGRNPLIIVPNANGFNNSGAVQVLSNSTLGVNLTQPANAMNVALNNSGIISAQGGAAFELASGSATGSALVLNNGTIRIGGEGNGGSLWLNSSSATSQTFIFAGNGSIVLSDANNQVTGLSGKEALVLNSGQTLSGAGQFSGLRFVNSGTVIANGHNTLNFETTPGTSSVASFFNQGNTMVNPGSTLNAVVSAATSGIGFENQGAITVANNGTLAVDISKTSGGTGFINGGTITVQDGGTLGLVDTAPGSTAVINNFQGAINIGQSTGASLALEDNGQGATFDLMAANGGEGKGNVTLVNSTISGVSGDETLINDFANTIEGTGAISNLTLTNNSSIVANGGTLAINAKLTNLSGGTLTGGMFEAGDASSGVLQLPGDVTTNSSFVLLVGSGSAITDPSGKNALANLSLNANGGNLAIDSGASLIINSNLTNGAAASPSGIIQLHNGGALSINGDLTNWDQIETGVGEGNQSAGSTLNVTGTLINNFRAGDVEDFVELNAAGDTLNAGSVQNSAKIFAGTGAIITVNGEYTQTGGDTDVNGTLMAASITATGGTVESGGGVIETQSLANETTITADSTGFIGVGKGAFTSTTGYQQLANGTLDELIASSTNFGTISVTGGASLDGTLDVTLENGFTPTIGEQFAFLDFTPGDLSGTFANFLDQTFDNGLEKWTLDYNNAGGEITLTAEANTTANTPEPASWLLLGTGLLSLALLMKRRQA